MDIKTADMTQDEIDELQADMEVSLNHLMDQIESDMVAMLETAEHEGWTPEQYIEAVDRMMQEPGDVPVESRVAKGGTVGISKSMGDIAQAAGELDVDMDELRIGTNHEMAEHGVDLRMGVKIASDHLKEHPHYYSDLKKAGLL